MEGGLTMLHPDEMEPWLRDLYGYDDTPPPPCESCGAPSSVCLPDGSHWCHACDTAAKNLGYDELEAI